MQRFLLIWNGSVEVDIREVYNAKHPEVRMGRKIEEEVMGDRRLSPEVFVE